ncbi:MAG: histidine kinase [Crocinitomicaceae bacterium]
MYQSLFHSLQSALIIITFSGKVIEINKAAGLLLMLDEDKIKGRDFREWIEESKQEKFNEIILKLKTTNASSPPSLGTQLKLDSAEWIKTNLKFESFKDEENNFVLVEVVKVRQQENKTEVLSPRINDRLRQIVDEMLEGVQLVNDKWEYLYLNDTAVMQSQFSREELIGYSMPEKYPGIENTELFQVMSDCLADQKPRQMENEFNFPNGDKGWFQLSIQPMGNVLFILSIDVTELKRAKLVLLQQNHDLKNKNTEMLKFQSQLLSTQINPHFIFNVLSSVQAYVLKREIEPAILFIADFSRLMRSVLDNSMHTYIPLSKAIEFLEVYLGLEQKRLDHKFTYSIELSEEIDVDEVLIPPMILQPYLENTVVHGIGHLKTGGKITLKITQSGEHLNCLITDNGIGREASQKINKKYKGDSQSWAMILTGKRLDILSQLEERKYEVIVKDILNKNGAINGTEVVLNFPLITDWGESA